jgi:hypothetical protein
MSQSVTSKSYIFDPPAYGSERETIFVLYVEVAASEDAAQNLKESERHFCRGQRVDPEVGLSDLQCVRVQECSERYYTHAESRPKFH